MSTTSDYIPPGAYTGQTLSGATAGEIFIDNGNRFTLPADSAGSALPGVAGISGSAISHRMTPHVSKTIQHHVLEQPGKHTHIFETEYTVPQSGMYSVDLNLALHGAHNRDATTFTVILWTYPRVGGYESKHRVEKQICVQQGMCETLHLPFLEHFDAGEYLYVTVTHDSDGDIPTVESGEVCYATSLDAINHMVPSMKKRREEILTMIKKLLFSNQFTIQPVEKNGFTFTHASAVVPTLADQLDEWSWFFFQDISWAQESFSQRDSFMSKCIYDSEIMCKRRLTEYAYTFSMFARELQLTAIENGINYNETKISKLISRRIKWIGELRVNIKSMQEIINMEKMGIYHNFVFDLCGGPGFASEDRIVQEGGIPKYYKFIGSADKRMHVPKRGFSRNGTPVKLDLVKSDLVPDGTIATSSDEGRWEKLYVGDTVDNMSISSDSVQSAIDMLGKQYDYALKNHSGPYVMQQDVHHGQALVQNDVHDIQIGDTISLADNTISAIGSGINLVNEPANPDQLNDGDMYINEHGQAFMKSSTGVVEIENHAVTADNQFQHDWNNDAVTVENMTFTAEPLLGPTDGDN